MLNKTLFSSQINKAMYHKLPPEIFDCILEFAAVIYRRGEYVSQIAKNDPRFDVLKTIPPIQLTNHFIEKHRFYAVKLSAIADIHYFSKEYLRANCPFQYPFHHAYYDYLFHEDNSPPWVKKRRLRASLEKRYTQFIYVES